MGVFPMILVAISEGKNFPVRHDKRLIVEAKFDGEVMGSEPVPHVTFPQIQTEFGWEVDKKGLQMHRLQRTPIKLLWYAVDQELMRKESIGYIILDLRLAQERDLAPSWYPLLNCKYHREKPEVKIKLSLEKDNCPKEVVNIPKDNTFHGTHTYTVSELRDFRRQHSADAIPKVFEKTSVVSIAATSTLKMLEPVLLPESCAYRIGSPALCLENFAFSITLAFAANLNKLANSMLHRSSKDYYFYYSLFENDVMTGRFTSLLNPDFRAERASVKISSSAELLALYFNQHSDLQVVLYCGDDPLASGNILLHPFASIKNHDFDKEPLSIEDNVKLHPWMKPSRLPTSDELSPFVGVTVVLQKDADLSIPDKPDTPPKSNGTFGRTSPPSEPEVSESKKSIANGVEINGNGILHRTKDSLSDFALLSQALQNHPRSQYLQHQHSLNGNKPSSIEGRSSVPCHSTNTMSKATPFNVGSTKSNMWIMNGNHTPHFPANDNVPHHFCFSLDICSFRATRLDHPVNIFIRYSYPFFGSASSIVSQPDTEVVPNSMVNIPAGFCSFNFGTTPSMLRTTLYESPLILEVVHRLSRTSKQEQLIGTSRINLFQVFSSASTPLSERKMQGVRQMCSCKTPVTSPDRREIGELSATLTLDDFGPTSPICDKNPTKTKTPLLSQLRSSVSSFDVPSMKPNGYTQDELMQAAFDIELWKERQRETFRAELKEKEIQHLKILVTEWKHRDTEREVLLQRRLHECQKLEDRFKQMVQAEEIREKQLTAQETELSMRIKNFHKEQEQREKEMSFDIEKLRLEYEDCLRITRLKQLELEETISSLKRKIHCKDTEIQELKNNVETLRAQTNKQPDAELKTEVNILNMEKTELKEKFEIALASKQKYKVQWGQAVKQISVLQHKIANMEKLVLTKKDEELANLHQRLCESEKQQAALQNQAFTKITERVNGLQLNKKSSDEQDQESPSSQSASESLPATTPNPTTPGNKDTKNCGIHAEQLKARKENLLNSGMYTESDAIIKTLNNYIDKAKQISSS